MTEIEQMAATKSELQLAWRTQWKLHNRRGTLAGATGMGKTKPAIDEMMELWKVYKDDLRKEAEGFSFMFPIRPPRIFLAVPTEKLRDEGWPEEVQEWYGEEGKRMWDACVQAECYVSLAKVKDKHFDLVILDEVHWITPLSYSFFRQNTCDAVMGLTATAPDKKRDPDKYAILKEIAPVIFSYTLDQGVDDGVVADFTIHVVTMPLDNVTRNIKAGTKDKPFMTTEEAHYNYLTKNLNGLFKQQSSPFPPKGIEARVKFMMLKRTRFIYDLPSKTRVAKKMMEALINDKNRTIVFCGGIEQSRELCGTEVYNSKDKHNGKFEKFKAGEGSFLGVVNAANEGHNIADLDQAIVVQVNSNERHLVQRIGRAVRKREGHAAHVWILCVQNTADEKWVEKSLAGFDPSKIIYHSHKEFE